MADLCSLSLLFHACFVSIFHVRHCPQHLMIFGGQFNMWNKKKSLCACTWAELSKCASFCRVITLGCLVGNPRISIFSLFSYTDYKALKELPQIKVVMTFIIIYKMTTTSLFYTYYHLYSDNYPEISNIIIPDLKVRKSGLWTNRWSVSCH